MPFAVPMIWRGQSNHVDDCYFCLTNISGFTTKSKHKIVYPDVRSAIKPVAHNDDDLSVPTPPTDKCVLESDEDTSTSNTEETTEDFLPRLVSTEPHFLSQEDLNDLCRDLYLSQRQSEILASRLKEWNLVQAGVKSSGFRQRGADAASFFFHQRFTVFLF
ncbi:gats-like protein 3 [Plakobranchus ocellatus]|uniref:Gats-like protein 3 n=1 Tax=Plakobranchus ocellatus TaxID=259542 RepID=A0AAV4DGC5_9GAST|nr:gats-like protein 3 [Plakobranchus ocellatus]